MSSLPQAGATLPLHLCDKVPSLPARGRKPELEQYTPLCPQECEESFEKKCTISFSPRATNQTLRQCYKPVTKGCSGEGEQQCRTVYEASCTTRSASGHEMAPGC